MVSSPGSASGPRRRSRRVASGWADGELEDVPSKESSSRCNRRSSNGRVRWPWTGVTPELGGSGSKRYRPRSGSKRVAGTQFGPVSLAARESAVGYMRQASKKLTQSCWWAEELPRAQRSGRLRRYSHGRRHDWDRQLLHRWRERVHPAAFTMGEKLRPDARHDCGSSASDPLRPSNDPFR